MATRKRVETVSLSSLSKSIDKAVSLAGDKHGVSFDKGNLILNWEILGRILRDREIAGGVSRLDVAATITKNVVGIKGQPIVTMVGKEILVGFVERSGATFGF
jgi:hypothetical protein